ncbi:cytochrome D1 domain-containing protein [Natrinema pallidum]|uniref:Hydroxylamine reductase n=1 Tax=Natrinema pallidum DSM 3751 TaxID=1227495 RepID=L9YNS0_9EURY|nr:cytochrome D1 domain-containing protein [Natrinema pallidum]ELY74538.1 Hydroxylamine reductase [Natrinema pallidum DSM 3751]
MSRSESPAESIAEQEERIKRHLSASREIAERLEFNDELSFEMGLPSPGRRTFIKTSGVVAASAALAGCAGDDDDDGPESTDDEESPDEETPEAERSETVQLTAKQYEFQPQEIRVPPNTELTIEFTQSTFEKNEEFTMHTFYLEDPYDIGPIELPENTDDGPIDSVTFVTDEEGTFDFECSAYCGDGHAQMNGQLYVVPEGESVDEVDFTDMGTLKERHEILKEERELVQEPQHDLDLRDIMVVTERNNASVAMIDTVNDRLMERVENVGKAIHVHDFHPELPEQTREGAYVYTQSRQGEMYKIDLFDFERVAVADAGTDARDIAVSRDGNYVIGGFYNPNHLVICDAETMEPIKRIPTHTVNPDGESLGSRVCSLYDVPEEGLFLAGLKEGGEVWLIDYTQEDFPVVATIECGRTLHDGFFTADGRYFMIASQTDNQMDIIDTQERSHVAAIPMNGVPHPGPGALYPDEDLAFTTHAGSSSVGVWNTETWEAETMIDVRGSGLFIRKHEHSDYVWADIILTDTEDDAYVYTIDPDTLEVDQEIDCSQWGAAAAIHPEFSRDGEKVYISVWKGENESILVFDPNTGELLTQIEDLLAPTGKFLGVRAEGH